MNTGIICEFNPFHNGHKHLIDTVKNSDDGIICVMSGNFVQRGEFAIYDKWKRTKAAISGGADLVIEIPTIWSTLSAQGFARAGVSLLEATGIANQIAFGAECDDIELLYETAKKITLCDDKIKEYLKFGVSYPTARKNAVNSDILDYPNNILAIEYITASHLPCVAIKRIGEGHDTDDINYSASAIRQMTSYDNIFSIERCQRAIMAKLRTMSKNDFSQINDVSEGLENRIYDAVRQATSLSEIYSLIKTKRYTLSRIRRIVLRSYLGITKSDVSDVPYIRVLGFNEKGKEMLKEMKSKASLPIITNYSQLSTINDECKRAFEIECRCTDLYNLGCKKPLPCGTEQRTQIVLM